MPLIKSIQEVKTVLRISAVNSNAGMPDFEAAEKKYLIPKIGMALYSQILTAYNGSTLTTIETSLLQKLQRMVAPLAYYDDLPMMHVLLTETGVRKVQTDNMPNVYRWEFDKLEKSLANKGYQAEEDLFEFLEENKGQFASWTSSTQYQARNAQLIRTATEFNALYRLQQPYRTFNALVPVMSMIEDMYLIPTIGDTFLTELKGKPNPSSDEKIVIADLKKAMAHLTLLHSFEKMTVQITEDGASIYDRYADRGSSESAQPTPDMSQFVKNALKRDGNRYLSKAKSYLNAKASATVFATFYTSEFYTAPVEPVDRNKDKKSFRF